MNATKEGLVESMATDEPLKVDKSDFGGDCFNMKAMHYWLGQGTHELAASSTYV